MKISPVRIAPISIHSKEHETISEKLAPITPTIAVAIGLICGDVSGLAMVILPNVKSEPRSYVAQSVRKHDL